MNAPAPIRRQDIQIRDPFVLPLAETGRYYLFGTTDRNAWEGPGTGFDVYTGTDLDVWEGPYPAFRPDPGFWATTQFWAPEIHVYQGRYVLLASFKAPGACRGTEILIADSPLGPFRQHSHRPVTPSSWECLDGTLVIDDDKQPWMIFCHEWVQIGDGGMYAVRLHPDLTHAIAEPIRLFNASQAPWSRSFSGGPAQPRVCFVTDGPFVHRCEDGTLLMLWSSGGAHGYAMGVATSTTGVLGPWRQSGEAVYSKDGGHGMLFQTFGGKMMMALHAPNQTPHERAHFIPVSIANGLLSLT
jgi:arabinan endo-1,5-alpha-L-arabinosidase